MAPGLSGTQLREEIPTGATRLMVAFAEAPPAAAVTVALESTVTAVVVALNVAVVADPATVTDVGTVSTELLSDNVTVTPPAGATLVRVTVQVLEALGPRLAGQTNEDTSTDATRLTVAFAELALYVAVTVAL